MKKILIIGNNDVGLYNFRSELILRLIAGGLEVHFTVPYGEKVELIKDMGAIYYPIDLNRRGTSMKEDFQSMCEYKKLITAVCPAVILTYTIKPNIYAGLAARGLKIPCIATVTGLGTALQGGGFKTNLLKKLYKWGIRRNQHVFFQNELNKSFFMENGMVQKDRIVVVPGSGVNTVHFTPPTITAGKSGVRFLYIARVMRDKGIEEYLLAAQNVKREHPNAIFQILGYYDEDCYREQVEKLVRDGIIEYLGVSNDTRIQMAQADCIVLPSYHEGMSNVLLEGASFGLPLITTNINGCKEAVDDGTTGYLCQPKDVESLTAAMERFLSQTPEERKAMGLQGREKMLREFDRQIVIHQYMDRIEALI